MGIETFSGIQSQRKRAVCVKRIELKHIPLRREGPLGRLIRAVPLVVLALFVLQFAMLMTWPWLPFRSGEPRWPEASFLGLALLSTLMSLARQVPGQNVLWTAVLLFIISTGVESLNVLAGVPFGPLVYQVRLGAQLFHLVPWPVPFVWSVLILSSRGTARLVLRPWRTRANYGFWVIGLTTALILLMYAGLEPVAIHVEHFWVWKPTRLPGTWYGAPWVSFLGRGVTLLIVLVFLTPLWLNKKPVPLPPDYYPLVTWSLLCVWLAVATSRNNCPVAAVLLAVAIVPIAALALKPRNI